MLPEIKEVYKFVAVSEILHGSVRYKGLKVILLYLKCIHRTYNFFLKPLPVL